MHEQLLHLADMSQRPRVTIEVVPTDVGAHVGLLGAFAIPVTPTTHQVSSTWSRPIG